MIIMLNTDKKTVILYEYSSHIEAVNNAISILKNEWTNINENNVVLIQLKDENGKISLDTIKNKISDAENIVIINSLYGSSDLSNANFDKLDELITYAHQKNIKVIAMSTQLPYDVVKFKNADAIVITYLANWIRFKLDDYEKELPKYGPNVMAWIFMLFTQKDNMNGVLPVNIYDLDSENKFTNEVLYNRWFGLNYSKSETDNTDTQTDSELVDAYDWAFDNGITTIDSMDKADLEWWLTRIAMAKMLSNYAMNVLGKYPDISLSVPNFSDVDENLNVDYNNWVYLAYQLWIMWIWIEEFRPFDYVTRAEFATALSRMLYNLEDWTENYYSTHIAKLKEEWIISNDNPDIQELRGYVMLMLFRSAK